MVVISAFAGSILKSCFGTGREAQTPTGTTTILRTLVKGSAAEVKKVISRQGGRASITQLQKLELPREERRMRNRTLVRCLANSQAKAFIKLKGFPNKETARQIVDDYNHSPSSLVGQAKDRVEDLTNFMSSKFQALSGSGPSIDTNKLKRKLTILWKMAVSYLDLVRDIVLVVLILQVTGHIGLFNEDSTHFQNVVIWILIATIVVPLFISAAITSANHPLTVFEFQVWRNFTAEQPGWWKMAFIRLVVFSFYIFVPAVLIYNKENAKLRRETLQEQGKEEYDGNDGILSNDKLEEMKQIAVYLDEVRKAHLVLKSTEYALELVAQQAVQLTMMLLSRTLNPVVSGLQGIFSVDSETLLALSVCWSFRTGIASFLKIHSEQKAGMLSAPAKIVLGLRALLFSVTRIVCITCTLKKLV